jgi:hypothetical protein
VTIDVLHLDIRECLFPQIVLFKSLQSQRQPPHFSPIRPEYEHLIADWELREQKNEWITCAITTNDGYKTLAPLRYIEIADREGESGAALYIWPNFVAADWKRYYLGFFSPSNPLGIGVVHAVVGESESAGGGKAFVMVDFVPRAVVVRFDADQQQYFAQYRIAPPGPHLEEIHQTDPVKDVVLGLDFGTTNSASALFYTARTNQLRDLPIKNRTLRLLDGFVPPVGTWLPQPEGPSKSFPFIPSQLFFNAPVMQTTTESHPVEAYTIPFFQSDPDPGAAPQQRRWVGQFKWKRKLGPLALRAYEFRYLYLQLALQLFLAEVVAEAKIRPCAIKLVAARPLAFDEDDVKLHDQVLSDVQPVLARATGFDITTGPTVDESHAAAAIGQLVPEAVRTIRVDVGGGSTDICVSTARPSARDVSVVDSFEYGGEDVNAYITDRFNVSPIELSTQIRLRGSAVYRDASYLGKKEDNVAKVGRVIEQFRSGLIESVCRFIAAETSRNGDAEHAIFAFLMFGSGWKTVFDTDDHRQIEEQARDQIGKRLESYKGRKILGVAPKIICRYPPDPKAVVARGAANWGAANLNVAIPAGNTYALENLTAIVDGREEKVKWSDSLPMTFSKRVMQLRLPEQSTFDFENWALLRDLDLHPCMRDQRLIRSPFAVYLERAYKNWR